MDRLLDAPLAPAPSGELPGDNPVRLPMPDIVNSLAWRGLIELLPVPRRGWLAAEDCEAVLRVEPAGLPPHEQAVLDLFFGCGAAPGARSRLRHKVDWLLWHLGPLGGSL